MISAMALEWPQVLECMGEVKCGRLLQVGFGKDFQASRNIDNDVGRNFRLLGSFLTEVVKRNGDPLRQFSRSPVRFYTLLCIGFSMFALI